MKCFLLIHETLVGELNQSIPKKNMEVKLYHNVFSLRYVASCHPQCRCDGDPSFSSGRCSYSILYTVYVNRCRCDVDFLTGQRTSPVCEVVQM